MLLLCNEYGWCYCYVMNSVDVIAVYWIGLMLLLCNEEGWCYSCVMNRVDVIAV
jgi:hypothetical protein